MDDFLDPEEKEELENIEVVELVSRYEEMIKNNCPIYLSLDDYENLFMYYTVFHSYACFTEDMNLEMAAKVIQDGIKQYPDSPLLQIFYIYYKYLTDEYCLPETVKLLKHVYLPEYEKIDMKYYIADIYIRIDAYSEAISLFEELLKSVQTKEDKIDIYNELIFLSKYGYEKDINKICYYLEKLIALDPAKEKEYLAHVGYEMPSSEESGHIFPILELYTSRHLFSVQGWLALGKEYMRIPMYEKAEEALRNAVALSEDTEVLISMASLYQKWGKGKKALEYYLEAMSHSPSNRDFYMDLAEVFFTMRLLKQAQFYGNLFLEKNPDNAYGWFMTGLFYYGDEQYEVATHYVEKAIKRQEEYDDKIITLLAMCKVAMGKGEDMIEIYEKLLLEDHAIYPRVWINYSDYYVMMKDYKHALEVLNRGWNEVEHGRYLILYRMANYYYIEGDYHNGSTHLILALMEDKSYVDKFLAYDEQTAILPEVIEIIKEFTNND